MNKLRKGNETNKNSCALLDVYLHIKFTSRVTVVFTKELLLTLK